MATDISATTGMSTEQQEVLTKLAEIIEEIAEVPAGDISLDKRFVDDLDIDSLSMIEIAAQTEATFELDIAIEALAELLTVGDAVDLVLAKRP
ncbi:acyl carrier protein [Streptomyces sp. NPDC051954]|uniref:acyl carrier protein n=1 Tax=unclassified Streptomyces TaxID=2593676 RepID=UPI00344905E3